jgi:phosphoglycolate phosphatase
MSEYVLILFDLDGTLTDPRVGITRSVRYALAKFGLQADIEQLITFIGPPLHESFQHFYSFDETQARQAVEYYREYYSATGIYENAVYPGIPELLEQLKAQGKTITVATSKPTFFAEKVLAHFNLSAYFTLVAGSNLDGTRTVKAEIINYVMQKLPNFPKQSMVMIGDRKHDVIGAQCTGIDSIAVTYGYGSLEELTNAAPTYLVHSVKELKSLLGA